DNSLLYGTEFETSAYPTGFPLRDHHEYDARCSVCLASNADTTFVLWGSQVCPSGWTAQYIGYIMSHSYTQNASDYVCVDRNAEPLYAGARAVDWTEHLTVRHTFAVESTLRDSELTHSRYAALKVKDAIADAMRDKLGARPDVNAKDPDVRIVAHIARDAC